MKPNRGNNTSNNNQNNRRSVNHISGNEGAVSENHHSAQYLKDLNASKYAETLPRAVYGIKENHYVDELLDSLETDD